MRELANFRADVARILGFTVLPYGKVRNLELTRQRLHDWQKVNPPPVTSERGGSSSPREVEERLEDAKVARWAMWAADEFEVLLPVFADGIKTDTWSPALLRTTRRLARIVELCTIPIDHSKLPQDEDPGCVSCSRRDDKRGIGGHYEPVAKRYKGKGLCRWCGEFAAANRGSWPPLEAVDIRERQGTQAAGRWLSRNGIKSRKKKAA